MEDASKGATQGAVSIGSRIDPDMDRARDLMVRSSIERPVGSLTPGLEYTWTDSTHLPGSRRLAAPDGWIDQLESNRFARKHQVHLRLQYQRKGQQIVAHYEWIRSVDDTDGPFSFPEFQNNLRAEVARSSGVAPHNLSIVGNFKFPAQVSVTVVDTYRGSSPYDITSGTDAEGKGLYNSRAGRPRNSGDRPSCTSLTLFGYRRIAVPLVLLHSKRKTYANVGVQVENLLNNRNFLSMGSVTRSPLFATPMGGLPGRSIRLTFNLDY